MDLLLLFTINHRVNLPVTLQFICSVSFCLLANNGPRAHQTSAHCHLSASLSEVI